MGPLRSGMVARALALVLLVASAAQASVPEVIGRLVREAEAVQRGERDARRRPDFARSYGEPLPLHRVARALGRSHHRDPFIDAYVRWQLTGFDPPLPDDDRAFERLLASLPALVPNPMADRGLIDDLTRISREAALSPAQLATLEERLKEIGTAAKAARDKTRPAVGLRVWIATRTGERGARAIQTRLERCRALIQAGWNPEATKTDIEKCCARSADDAAFARADRERVAAQAATLAGTRRPFIASAQIIGDRLSIRFEDAAVYDFDTRRWARTILR